MLPVSQTLNDTAVARAVFRCVGPFPGDQFPEVTAISTQPTHKRFRVDVKGGEYWYLTYETFEKYVREHEVEARVHRRYSSLTGERQ